MVTLITCLLFSSLNLRLEFEPLLVQTKDYKFVFAASLLSTLRRKSKD
jgi:hypothetical protein